MTVSIYTAELLRHVRLEPQQRVCVEANVSVFTANTLGWFVIVIPLLWLELLTLPGYVTAS